MAKKPDSKITSKRDDKKTAKKDDINKVTYLLIHKTIDLICINFVNLNIHTNRYYLQDKSETEKIDVELEERKFEPSANDRDLVEILGNIYIIIAIDKHHLINIEARKWSNHTLKY